MDDQTRKALWTNQAFSFGPMDSVKVRTPQPALSASQKRNRRRAKSRQAHKPAVTVAATVKTPTPVRETAYAGGSDWTHGQKVIALGEWNF